MRPVVKEWMFPRERWGKEVYAMKAAVGPQTDPTVKVEIAAAILPWRE